MKKNGVEGPKKKKKRGSAKKKVYTGGGGEGGSGRSLSTKKQTGVVGSD